MTDRITKTITLSKTPWLIKTRIYNSKFINIFSLTYIMGVIGYYYLAERPWIIVDNFFAEFGIILIAYLLHFLSSYSINGIYKLFGIDLVGNRSQDIRIRCEPLFDMNTYGTFQSEIADYFSRKRGDVLSILFGIGMTAVITAPSIIAGQATYAGTEPYIIYTTPPNGPSPVFYFRLIASFPLTAWLISGFVSLLIILMKLIIVFDKVGKSDDIAIKRINMIINRDGDTTLEFDKRSDIVRFSLKRFKQRATVIPQFMLVISLSGLFLSMIVGLNLNLTLALMDQEKIELFQFLVNLLLFVLVIANIILFLYPQISLKRIITSGKLQTVDMLEEMLVVKQYQWLSIMGEKNTEEKDALFKEITGLSTFITDLDSLLTWPFNYKQLATLFGSSIFTLIAPFIKDFL